MCLHYFGQHHGPAGRIVGRRRSPKAAAYGTRSDVCLVLNLACFKSLQRHFNLCNPEYLITFFLPMRESRCEKRLTSAKTCTPDAHTHFCPAAPPRPPCEQGPHSSKLHWHLFSAPRELDPFPCDTLHRLAKRLAHSRWPAPLSFPGMRPPSTAQWACTADLPYR